MTESFFACRWRSCQNCPDEAVSAMRICSTLDFELSPKIQSSGTSVTLLTCPQSISAILSPQRASQGFTNVKTLRIHTGNGSSRVGLSTTDFEISASILPNIESQLLIFLYSTSDVSLLRCITSNFAKMTLKVILSQMRSLLTSVWIFLDMQQICVNFG